MWRRDLFPSLCCWAWWSLWIIVVSNTNSGIDALAPPNKNNFADYVNVHEYRRQRNITYGYRPRHINAELCRYATEDECRHMDVTMGPSSLAAHKLPPSQRTRFLNPSMGQNIRILVLLVRFTDHADRALPPREYFDTMFNGQRGQGPNKVGSIASYFAFASMGVYDVTFDVQDWVTTSNTEAFFSFGKSGLVDNVQLMAMFAPLLDQLDSGQEFWWDYDVAGNDDDNSSDGVLDHLVIIHSGYGAEEGNQDCLPPSTQRLWSRGSFSSGPGAWTNREGNILVGGYTVGSALRTPACNDDGSLQLIPNGMGIITHEMMHGFGLVDLYDQDDGGGAIQVGGVGRFDVMANAIGWNGDRDVPGHMGPYSRMLANWVAPIELTVNGVYAIQPSELSSQVFKISAGFPDGEYLLVENRAAIKWDKDWPTGGVLIWHIDEQADGQRQRGYPGSANWPQRHYMVAIVPKDGNYDLEKGNNMGDEGDFWLAGDRIGPGGDWPNTDAYQNGNRRNTGIAIEFLSGPGFIMHFRITGLPGNQAPALGSDVEATLQGGIGNSNNGTDMPAMYVRPGDEETGVGKTLAWMLSMLGGLAVVIGLMAFLL